MMIKGVGVQLHQITKSFGVLSNIAVLNVFGSNWIAMNQDLDVFEYRLVLSFFVAQPAIDVIVKLT